MVMSIAVQVQLMPRHLSSCQFTESAFMPACVFLTYVKGKREAVCLRNSTEKRTLQFFADSWGCAPEEYRG
jgi:hypothetical protein